MSRPMNGNCQPAPPEEYPVNICNVCNESRNRMLSDTHTQRCSAQLLCIRICWLPSCLQHTTCGQMRHVAATHNHMLGMQMQCYQVEYCDYKRKQTQVRT